MRVAEYVDEEEAYPDPFDYRNWQEEESPGSGGGEAGDPEAGGLSGRKFSAGPSAEPEEGKLRFRHDGFTPEKRQAFLAALEQTGCVDDACRMAGISDTTAYRTREKLPDFARAWNAALARAAMPLRALAWERATQGAEIKLIRDGKHVESRFKPSDSMLRLLMQGADPDAYGRPFGGAGGARGKVGFDQLDAASRKRVQQEAYRKYQLGEPERKADLIKKLTVLLAQVKKRRRAAAAERFENGGGV